MSLNPIADMPDEIMHQILSNLDERSLARCTGVSCVWNRLASDDALWKGLYPAFQGTWSRVLPVFNIPDTGIKKYLCERAIGSQEQLLKRVKAFADQIQFGKMARFICRFPHHSHAYIAVGCCSGRISRVFNENCHKIFNVSQADLEETWFFLGRQDWEIIDAEVSIMRTNYFVFGSLFVSRGITEHAKLAKEMVKIVADRHEILAHSQDRDFFLLQVTLVAMIAIGLAIYFTNWR